MKSSSTPLRSITLAAGVISAFLALGVYALYASPPSDVHENVPFSGDLGGVLVRLPSDAVRFVEFDSNPTVASRRAIRSFGFDLTAGEVGIAESGNADRVARVSVRSHSNYGSDEQIISLADNASSRLKIKFSDGEKIDDLGLELYQPTTPYEKINPGMRLNYVDIFIARDWHGNATVYIECTTGKSKNPGCSLYYLLIPEMRAAITVRFARSLLNHWKSMKTASSARIHNFVVAQHKEEG